MSGSSSKKFMDSKLYNPPIEEFSILSTTVSKATATVPGINGPGILLVTELVGKATAKCGNQLHDLIRGQVWYIDANSEIKFEAEDRMVCYQAYCDLHDSKGV
jgi:mannose-6-phosphate isomerase